MTTGETIGIALGVAGLGIGGYMLWKSMQAPRTPTMAALGAGYGPANQYQQPRPPPSQVQQDVAQVANAVGQGAVALASVFETFSNLFA